MKLKDETHYISPECREIMIYKEGLLCQSFTTDTEDATWRDLEW